MTAPRISDNMGRPRVFETPDELIAACDAYFEYIQGEWHEEDVTTTDKQGNSTTGKQKIWDRFPEPATVTGLALHLGFESRQSIYDYEKNGDFSYIIKKAKTFVECSYEKNLSTDKPTGAIFALKNMGWKDNIDMTSGGEVIKTSIVTLPNGGEIEI